MRRLTVVQLLPELDSGGVERSTLEVADALERAGHRSIVISGGGRLTADLRRGGSRHIELGIGRKSLFVLRQIFALRQVFARLKPDIVHARSRLPAWLAWAALKTMPRTRARFVTTVHGLNSRGRYSSILTRGERVICVSDTVRRHVLSLWPDTDPSKLQVIERGVDPADFPRDLQPTAEWRERWKQQFPALSGGPLLLLPGRGTRLKGHAWAIRLLAALRDEGVDARLCLLGVRETGRGHYCVELETLAQSLGVAEAIALLPPRSDIAEIYAVSDIVLQLSEKPEAFGRTVMEALASGRPVLGWKHGGVGELLSRHFPQGAVTVFDEEALVRTAREWLAGKAPEVPDLREDGLARMQARTLELYDALVAS